MIKLYDAQITDALPDVITMQPWAQALAYAVREQIRKLLNYADASRSIAVIDTIFEKILDILAVELQATQYREEYSLKVKRAIVKNALNYWSKAGTKASVEGIVDDIFGDSQVQEWYEYNGEPGYFKISTTNPNVTDENINEFKKTVESIKRLSAHFTTELILEVDAMQQYIGFAIHTKTTVTMTMNN